MSHITFDEVAVIAVKKWVDENGKRRQKTKKFFQTINPFNRNASGFPKTRAEVMVEICEARSTWLKSDSKE